MRSTALAKWTLLACLLVAAVGYAFKPNETAHGHRMITEGVLLNGYSYGGHRVPVFTTRLSDGKSARFAPVAAGHVVKGNVSTDLFTADFEIDGIEVDLPWELDDPVAHCDNEMIEACSNMIRDRRSRVVAFLATHIATGDKLSLGLARGYLGKALHTLQDFYAHSNHADVHSGAEIFEALTSTAAATAGAFSRGPGVTVCQSRAATATITDYTNNGGNWRLIEAGRRGGKYTTGFFTSASAVGSPTAADAGGAKCDHGNENVPLRKLSGIAKDVPFALLDDRPEEEILARARPTAIHARASFQAALHTSSFLDSVIADIRRAEGDAAKQDLMIKALLGIDSEALFGFVVDRTGSMGSTINGVRLNIQRLIDESLASGGAAATRKFMVVDYGDPDVSTPVIGLAAQVKDYVSTLVASGGGDCPESTNAALRSAVAAAPTGSTLFVFTDASSNDGHLAAEVMAAAQAKRITINYAASGSCSPIDPSYYSIAAATGGQVIVTEHTEEAVAAAFTGISIDSLGIKSQPVLIEAGDVTLNKTLLVRVEPGASRLSITASVGTGTLTFLAPGGAQPGSNAVINEFVQGRGLKVTNPQAGTWSVVLQPVSATNYSVRAEVAGNIDLSGASFSATTRGGRASHDGFVELKSPPEGRSRMELQLAGAASVDSVELVRPDGTRITQVEPTRTSENTFAAGLVLGNEIFRIVVRGKVASGASFVRMLPTLYGTRPFSLEVVDLPTWARGTVGEMRVRITNHSERDVYSLTATTAAAAGTVVSVEPDNLTLARGDSEVVSVKVAVADAAPLGVNHSLRVVATGTDAGPRVMNRTIRLEHDSDGDSVPDTSEMGPAGTEVAYDGNGDGVADWQQAAVASFHSRRRNGYVSVSVPHPARLVQASSSPAPRGSGEDLDYDLFRFEVRGITSGQEVLMRLRMPEGFTATAYLGYGPETGQRTPHWYSFARSTTAVDDNMIAVRLKDGGRGDSDLTANGVIEHAGSPAGVRVAGVFGLDSPPESGGGGGGGGGGCTIGDPSQKDGSLVLLSLIAGVLVLLRRRPLRRLRRDI